MKKIFSSAQNYWRWFTKITSKTRKIFKTVSCEIYICSHNFPLIIITINHFEEAEPLSVTSMLCNSPISRLEPDPGKINTLPTQLLTLKGPRKKQTDETWPGEREGTHLLFPLLDPSSQLQPSHLFRSQFLSLLILTPPPFQPAVLPFATATMAHGGPTSPSLGVRSPRLTSSAPSPAPYPRGNSNGITPKPRSERCSRRLGPFSFNDRTRRRGLKIA